MIKKLVNNSAFSGTIIVTIGSFIGSVLSYILQLFLGRMLTVEEFGTFNTLLLFSTILGVFSGALSVSIIKKVSSLCAKEKFDVLTKLFWNLNIIGIGLGFLLFLPLYTFQDKILEFLNISNVSAFLGFIGLMSLTFVSILPRSYLQGLLRFKSFAFINVISIFLRTLFPIVLVLFGYSIGGVFIGMIAASIISIGLAILLLKKNFDSSEQICLNSHYKSLLLFVGPLIFMRVGLTLLNNVDIVLVKHLFSASEAGIYAGLVTVGKILLFGAASVSTVMFPQISAAAASNDNPRKELRPYLWVQLFLVGLGALVFVTFPKFITLIMFGKKYLPVVEYLPKFSLFMAFYVLINFFVLFFIAVEKYFATLFLGIGVVLQTVLIWFFHDSLSTVVNINVGITGVVLFLLIVYYKFFMSSQKRF